jgi:hypothetical protein
MSMPLTNAVVPTSAWRSARNCARCSGVIVLAAFCWFALLPAAPRRAVPPRRPFHCATKSSAA